jgi:uncharacterized membrane protein HdeD (DUF308 family)
VIVGLALVENGLADIARALTGRNDKRAAELIGRLASVVFGVLALSWPDVTVVVVAVLFGARTVLFGFSQPFAVVTDRREPAADEAAQPSGRTGSGAALHIATRSVALVAAQGLFAVSAR